MRSSVASKPSTSLAKAPARRTHMVPNSKVTKLKTRLSSLSKRAATTAVENDHLLCSVGAAAAFAYAEKQNVKLPSIMGIDPALLLGGVLYIGGRKLAGGKSGKRIEAAGEGLLAVATARAVQRGGVKVSLAGTQIVGDDGDDDDDLDD